MPLQNEQGTVKTVDRLLDKWDIEERTSLDITTIYRKMKSGTFPQPVRVGKRRVAWRESDVAEWQRQLEVGTRVLGMTRRARPISAGGRHRSDSSAQRRRRFARCRP